MKFKRLNITVNAPARENESGCTGGDYARDAAREIETGLGDYQTWAEGDDLAERTATRMAEKALSQVKIGGEYLKIEIEDFEVEE